MTDALNAAARTLRRAAGSGSSDPSPNYVKVDPLVILALADLLEAVDPLGYAMGGSKAETLVITDTWYKANAVAAAINEEQP